METYYQQNKDKLLEYQKEYQNKIPKRKKRLYNNKYYHNVRKNKKEVYIKPVNIKEDENYLIEF